MAKAQKSPPEEEAFYVNLRKPIELRRHILEASKMVIFSLQNYHNLLKIKEEKTKKVALLKVQVGEINLLCAKLVEFLPDYHIKMRKELEEAEEKRKKGRKKSRASDEPSGVGEIEKLESALHGIEHKLNRLS